MLNNNNVVVFEQTPDPATEYYRARIVVQAVVEWKRRGRCLEMKFMGHNFPYYTTIHLIYDCLYRGYDAPADGGVTLNFCLKLNS